MIKNKTIRVSLLCFGLINSVMVSSNPLTELGCGVFAVIANTMHIVNCLAEENLKKKIKEMDKRTDLSITQRGYIANQNLGVWGNELFPIITKHNYFEYHYSICKRIGSNIVLLPITLSLNLFFGSSNSLSIGLSTFNGITAAPQSLKLIRGYARLDKAQKQAATITQDNVQGYQIYINSNKNFMQQTHDNILIKQDQKLNKAFFDQFGRSDGNDNALAGLRSSVQPQALADDDLCRTDNDFRKTTIKDKIAHFQRVQENIRGLSKEEIHQMALKDTKRYEDKLKNEPMSNYVLK